MHRSLVSDFLTLMRDLRFSAEETKIADNYFSILNNRPVETWFDQGIELGGGQPFTVGTEGNERNERHIVRAFPRSTLPGPDLHARDEQDNISTRS
jgi:hypothetical protein